MANFTDSNTWGAVLKLETSTAVLGGDESAPSNLPLKQLNNRTFWLHELIGSIISGVTGLVGKLLNGSTVANTFTAQQSDTAVASTAFVQNSIALMAGKRNAILNGNFKIAQRGITFPLAAGDSKFTLDRWLCELSSGTRTAIVTQEKSAQLGILKGANQVLRIQLSAAGGTFSLKQRIASVYSFEGNNVTVQLAMNLPAAKTFTVSMSQYLNHTQIAAGTPHWGVDTGVSGVSGFQIYTVTFAMANLITVNPSDLDDSNCIELSIKFADPSAADIWIGNVQLEQGAIASSFEHSDDTNDCLLYYEQNLFKENSDEYSTGALATMTHSYRRIYCNRKRIIPAVTFDHISVTNLSDNGNVTDTQINSVQLQLQPSGWPWLISGTIMFNAEII